MFREQVCGIDLASIFKKLNRLVSDFVLDRVISIIDPNNVRSIRVAEKLGMKLCGDVMLDGYDHPDGVYACERKPF